MHAPCSTREHEISPKFERLAGLKNVVDQGHVAPLNGSFDVAENSYFAARDAGAIAPR